MPHTSRRLPAVVPRVGELGGPLYQLHLASPASSYTTGAIIRVDGGLTGKV